MPILIEVGVALIPTAYLLADTARNLLSRGRARAAVRRGDEAAVRKDYMPAYLAYKEASAALERPAYSLFSRFFENGNRKRRGEVSEREKAVLRKLEKAVEPVKPPPEISVPTYRNTLLTEGAYKYVIKRRPELLEGVEVVDREIAVGGNVPVQVIGMTALREISGEKRKVDRIESYAKGLSRVTGFPPGAMKIPAIRETLSYELERDSTSPDGWRVYFVGDESDIGLLKGVKEILFPESAEAESLRNLFSKSKETACFPGYVGVNQDGAIVSDPRVSIHTASGAPAIQILTVNSAVCAALSELSEAIEMRENARLLHDPQTEALYQFQVSAALERLKAPTQ